MECDVGAPQVNYRESISRVADIKYIHRKQSGGSGQFADVSIRFEPGEPGTGFEFRSEIKGGAIPKEFIPGVVKGLEEMMSSGSLAGFPVVDVVAVLHDGSYHDVDSSVLAFQIAARAAFREGMRKGAARLLEPIMEARSPAILISAKPRHFWHPACPQCCLPVCQVGGASLSAVLPVFCSAVWAEQWLTRLHAVQVEVTTPEDHMGDVIGACCTLACSVHAFSTCAGVGVRVCLVP